MESYQYHSKIRSYNMYIYIWKSKSMQLYFISAQRAKESWAKEIHTIMDSQPIKVKVRPKP